jgi:hypothetical protein
MLESDEISLLNVDMKIIGPPFKFWTWVAPTESVREFAFDHRPIYAQNKLETWLELSDEIRVYMLDI